MWEGKRRLVAGLLLLRWVVVVTMQLRSGGQYEVWSKECEELQEYSRECQVCLEPLLIGDVEVRVCGHVFHVECLRSWYEVNGDQTCPTCRHDH